MESASQVVDLEVGQEEERSDLERFGGKPKR